MKLSTSLVPAVAVGAALLTPAAAAAKGIDAATVCGADRCVEVRDRMLLSPLAEGRPPTDPPREPAGWFRTTATARDGRGGQHTFTFAALPSIRRIRGEDGTWMPMGELALRAFTRITRGMEPRPASTLPGAPGALRSASPAPRAQPASDAPVWPVVVAALLASVGLAGLARRRPGLVPRHLRQ